MEYILKGKFQDVVNKARELSKYINVTVENGEVYIHSNHDYFLALNLLKEKGLIDEEEYRSEAQILYKGTYNDIQNKKLENEEYEFLIDTESVTIYNVEEDKYLSFVRIPNESFDSYMIIARDSNKDKKAMSEREIPFIIREDSPLYEILDNFYKNNNSNTILSSNNSLSENYVNVEKQIDDSYKMLVVKQKNDSKYSNESKAAIYIGNALDNDKWLVVDSIYNKLHSIGNRQRVFKK